MSQAISPSTAQPYGLARVCRVWGFARSTVYWQRHECATPGTRRGPLGPCTDDELVDHIRRILAASPFPGEGYRKVWARLRHGGLRTSPRRVLCLMRAHHLLAPTRQGHPQGPKAHDGTIIPAQVDTMWGTDMTATCTRQEGQVAILKVFHMCWASQRPCPNSYRLMNSPITRSCLCSVLEKQIVRRINRLIRVRRLICLLSIFCVCSLPT
jgi:putative transposase